MTRWYRLKASGNASIYPGVRNTVARLLLCFIYKKVIINNSLCDTESNSDLSA